MRGCTTFPATAADDAGADDAGEEGGSDGTGVVDAALDHTRHAVGSGTQIITGTASSGIAGPSSTERSRP